MAEQAAPADAQPTDQGGQGEGGNNELHSQFLSSVPEHLRGSAAELVPIWDKFVQGKFQESAEYRKQWEPYEQIEGFKDTSPEDMTELFEFKNNFLNGDPDSLRELHKQLGEVLEEESDDTDGDEDSDDGDDDPIMGHPAIKQMMEFMQNEKQEREQIAQQEQQQQAMVQNTQLVTNALDKLSKDNPEINDDVKARIVKMAAFHTTSTKDYGEAIMKAYDDYKEIVSGSQNELFEKKNEQPPPAEQGGVPNTSAQPITSYEDAKRAAQERIRNSF